MNLKKLFNFKFLVQNLKKSRVVLLLFALLMPIINTLMLVSKATNGVFVPSFMDISGVNVIAMYILPIIIAICLFNYVFKKQSVDFVNSMPISRKSVYVTNVISSVLLLLSMILINIVLIFLVKLIFNIPIPFMMIVDYLVIWFINYFFVFCASILAISISGNAITSVIVTLLLIFFIPFSKMFIGEIREENTSYDYLIEVDNPSLIEGYSCFNDSKCLDNLALNRYNAYLRDVNEDEVSLIDMYYFQISRTYTLYSKSELMFLSLIYLFIGYILFNKRKMEVNETSFRNIHLHNIVKNLTLLPFVAVSYVIVKDELSIISILFVLIILMVYSVIYDLITKKGIHNLKYMVFYFVFFVSLYVMIFAFNDRNRNEEILIRYDEIESVGIKLEGTFNDDIIYIKNDELKDLIIKNMYYNSKVDEDVEYVTAYMRLKNKKEYSTTIYLTLDYDNVMDILYKDEEYNSKFKAIDYDKIYALMVGDSLYNKSDYKELISLIKDKLANLSLKEYLLLMKYNNYNTTSIYNGTDYDVKLYSYMNNRQYVYYINSNLDSNILNYVVNTNNKYLKENIKNIVPLNYKLYHVNHRFDIDYDINYTVMYNSKNEIYNYILKELDNKVDMSKEYIVLNVCLDNRCYNFASNNVNDFKNILEVKKQYLEENNDI